MSNWLNHDHQQFEMAVHRCRDLCDSEDWTALRDEFRQFAASYESHVRLEEDALFPMYEEQTQASSEPTDSLREDHAQIFRLTSHIEAALRRDDRQGIASDVALLYRTLSKHHEKEEEVFLPMASELLLADKDNILAELKRRAGY